MKVLTGLLVVFLIAILASSTALSAKMPKGVLLDMPDEIALKYYGEVPQYERFAEQIAERASRSFTGDTLKLLVVLLDWSNRPGTYSQAVFDSLILSRDVYPGGSVADFFYESSYGNLTITGQVFDWYNAGVYDPYFDFESMLWELDPIIDYSQFDGNGDGIVDAIAFIRSGTGQEDTGDDMDIWSHAVIYPSGWEQGPFDGVLVGQWFTAPEERPLRSETCPSFILMEDTLCRIHVICHELTHDLGMPDLYDYDEKLNTDTYSTPNDANDHPLVDWSLMGYGGYGLLAYGYASPAHHCSWMKMHLGWIDPIVLNQGTYENLVINSYEVADDSSLYMIPIDMSEGEYFLMAFRNPQSSATFDKLDSDFSAFFCPNVTFGNDTLDQGLLITHVHDSVTPPTNWWRINNGTPDWPHYTVIVEDMGYNPSKDTSFNAEGHVTDSAQWWYPYETRRAAPMNPDVAGQEEFGPSTYPSSDSYFGPTGIVVRVDSIVGEKLYAYVHNPVMLDQDGDGISDESDNCISTYNPLQEDSDSDMIGDSCDNCIFVLNPNQEDTDSDGVGDSCDNCIFALNPNQEDADLDGVGDSCDNCINVFNPDQADANGNGVGDVCDWICGDADASREIDIDDVVYLINYIFASGPAPDPLESGDADCSGGIDIDDVVYLINYIFAGGNSPCDPDGNGNPDC